MKKRIMMLIAGLLAAAGPTIYNHTGTDIMLPDGTIMVSHDLEQSLTKHYIDRNIEDSLTVVYHHTAGPVDQSLESIAKFHVEQNGWPEIAYHIAVNQDGDIHLLNDLNEKTYHNSKDNTNTIGVVSVGNFELEEPSQELIESLKAVDRVLNLTLKLKPSKGHRDYKATLCPGTKLYECLQNEKLIY